MPRPKDIDTAEGRKRHEEKYQRILSASMEVFARKGFAESKISEIAQVAGVGDGTIYLYFKNKDDLLISLFESKLEEINQGLRESLQGVEGPENQLKAIIDFHLGLAINSVELAALVTIELRRSQKFMKDYAKEQLAEFLGQWNTVLEAGQASGVFREDFSTNIFKFIMFGSIDHVIGLWVSNPNRSHEDLVEVGRQLKDAMMRAVIA